MVALNARDTNLLRNSRLMGIPEFRCMANDVEMYRRSKVTSFGPAMKAEGAAGFQERFYWILSDLLWRVCENFNEISQADFYKLYRWFHVTRKLLKPPAPQPDYVSPFAKKEDEKVEAATIKMFTRTNTSLDLLLGEQDTMRSRVDPAKYLGSHVSLTESITSSLRLGSPATARAGDALLRALSVTNQDTANSGPMCAKLEANGVKSRTLGTIRSDRISTAPAGVQRKISIPGMYSGDRSNSADVLPNIRQGSPRPKSKQGVDSEVDADVTIVDPDAVLDQGSELILKMGRSPSPTHVCLSTPPLPSVDVLSKRQLKLISTNSKSPLASNNCFVDKPLSDLIKSSEEKSPKRNPPGVTPSTLFEMAGHVGERMMVNRAKLLFIQHNSAQLIDRFPDPTLKPPPTAPAGGARNSPLHSVPSSVSRSTLLTTERASTAPVFPTRSTTIVTRKKSSKLRSTVGGGWGSLDRSDSVIREDLLAEPLTIHRMSRPATTASMRATTAGMREVPPPSSSGSSRSSGGSESDILHSLQCTPHKERCATYRDPLRAGVPGYHPLGDEEEEVALSETPLLQTKHDNFSSLSSFLPSNTSIVT